MSATTQKAGWQKEREAKQQQKQWESDYAEQNDHQEWQQNRNNMIKKKEEAEMKAKQAEANAPEFMKKLGVMREKSLQKPKKKEDEGPTIEELDDGTDIPPWHRANAPEKPEWVLLLLIAAAREAEEDEEEDEHVFVSGGNNNPQAEEPQSAASAGDDDLPEWMKQAKNLKSKPPRRRSSLSGGQTSKPSISPLNSAMKSIRRPGGKGAPARMKCKSASAALIMAGDDKPEWMKGAEALKKKKRAQQMAAAREFAVSPCPGAEQPAWMVQRSKIKDKAQPESPDAENKPKVALNNKSESEDSQPAWMAQRSKMIKQKADKEEALTAPDNNNKLPPKAADDNDDGKPAWMKHKLKPRVSVKELQESKVKEAVDNHKPIRQSSIKLTKEELKSNIVQQKLAKRPSLMDKKAPAKSEEMEWMKAKLKPGGDTKRSNTPTIEEEEPAWMKHKLKPRVSVKELQTSSVQEKLGKKQPIRKPSIKLSKEELTQNVVKQKLANRPSLVDKKAPAKSEEMEWMKQKLRPSNSKRNLAAPEVKEPNARPGWFKEASVRGLITSEDENDETTLKPSDSRRNLMIPPKSPPEDADKRPEWFREASSKGLLDTDDDMETNNGKNYNGTTTAKKRAAPRRQQSKSRLAHELEGESRPEWMREAQKRMPSLRSLNAGGDLEDDESIRSADDNVLPVPRVIKQGSMRRIATMPASTAKNMREGLAKRQSSKRLSATEKTPSTALLKQEDPSTSEEPTEFELDPMDLFKPKQSATKTLGKQKSFSSIKGPDAADPESKSKDEDLDSKLWHSMAELGSGTDIEGATDLEDGSSSSGSDDTFTLDSSIDFTASMNDIGAVLDTGPSLLGSPLGATLTHSKGSAPSLTALSSAERRKSRMSMRRKDRAKSRSRSGSGDKKKKRHTSKDKDKKKKKKKDSDEKKKEKKKERRASRKSLKAKNGALLSTSASFDWEAAKAAANKSSGSPVAETDKKKGWWEKSVPQNATAGTTSNDEERVVKALQNAVAASTSKTGEKVKKTDKKGAKEAPQSAWWESKPPKNDKTSRDSLSNWHSAEAPSGHTYYYNTETGKTQWEKPKGFK